MLQHTPLKRKPAAAAIVVLCTALAAGNEPPVTDALTEFSASEWEAAAQSAGAAVYDDVSRTMVGSAALRFETDGCFDTWMWSPPSASAGWDLLAAGCGGVGFWTYTENSNIGFQGPSPWVFLYTTPSDYFEFHPTRDFLNDARGKWVYISVPLNGNDVWNATAVGTPDLTNINYIEIHGDTWDCEFKMWIDGLTFDMPFSPPEGQMAIAGNGQVSLEWKPFNDITGLFDHYAVYRELHTFSDVTNLTPIHTIGDINTTDFLDASVVNGIHYYYAVTAVLVGGGETRAVEAVGPRTPRDESDLQVACVARTPRYPRYWPIYSGYWVTEPSGFGPYFFTAATDLGGGQTAGTQRWPDIGDPVTYVASVRNRGTNAWSGTLAGTWRVDGGVASTPAKPVALEPGAVTTFEYVLNWDDAWHEVTFTLDVADARVENNTRGLHTKSAPFLTYVDVSFIENFRETTPGYPQAATDDMIDWLQRHADEMNHMFAEEGSLKRVHYDVLEVLHDHEPDPGLETIYFGVFPYRYRGQKWGDPRSPGYYHADVDIDYGLCHEMSHQLGLVDIYQLDLPGDRNEVSGMGYSAVPGLMHGCSDFYSEHSARGMTHWADIVHGYYGQYMYQIPREIRLRILDYNQTPLPDATITIYQMVERQGQGKVITTQAKAQGLTNAAGEWTLPNVPVDPAMVPVTFAGDELHDNPFGYLAVVGTNGLLHFKIEYDQFVDYAWLDITEVNVAYWQGQTDVAIFERDVAIGGGTQHYPPPDMAELNAHQWDGWSQGGTTTISDDSDRKQVGQASVKYETTGGFDNYVRYPLGLLCKWDLSDVDFICLWVYAYNPNGAFQSQSPWIRLGSYQDGFFEWKPSWDILNQALNTWHEFVIPINGDATWTRSTFGTPALSKINYFELHADTWGAGFTLWLDGVRLDPQPFMRGDMNCDGAVDFGDINPFVLALSNWPTWQARYPDCPEENVDVNGDGQYGGEYGFGDINPFIDLLIPAGK